ncbi:YagK/YfjJ domain-containing protein [Pseudomonas moorei]|uniref:YagK/YfjJ domain-containing protein n=1 Tax=Pseudomonas moorei TaxID=395599 RepID=UPI00200EED43|nr:inovirus-type Gp2 protein [Pseudomonas moorei]
MKASKNRKPKSEITYKSTYKDISINTGKFRNLGVYTNMLKPMLGQINALLTHHSRVQLLRFDLHLPVMDYMPAASANRVITKFFKKIKQDLSSPKWNKQVNVIHCWAREVGKSQNGHYHCMIGISSKVRLGTIYTETSMLAWKLLQNRWSELSGGSLHGSTCHVVNRSNKKELDTAFFHLSYICKVRDKHFGTGEDYKRFSASRLKPKEMTDQHSTDDRHPDTLEVFFAA